MASHEYVQNLPLKNSFIPTSAPLAIPDHAMSFGQRAIPANLEHRSRLTDRDPRNLPPPSTQSWLPMIDAVAQVPAAHSMTGRAEDVTPRVNATNQDPILTWYLGNDGPFIPKGTIPDISSEQRYPTRGSEVMRPMSTSAVRHHHRSSQPSETGSIHFPIASDSGYASRRSYESMSLFSGDVVDRPQDGCAPLAAESQSIFGLGLNEPLSNWPENQITLIEQSPLFCQTCGRAVKTPSELRKHEFRHKKPFKCTFPGCTREEGFSTTNDLDRHFRSKHQSALSAEAQSKMYRCTVAPCHAKEKAWPRLDNFRSHLKRVHQLDGEQLEEVVRKADGRRHASDVTGSEKHTENVSIARLQEAQMTHEDRLSSRQHSVVGAIQGRSASLATTEMASEHGDDLSGPIAASLAAQSTTGIAPGLTSNESASREVHLVPGLDAVPHPRAVGEGVVAEPLSIALSSHAASFLPPSGFSSGVEQEAFDRITFPRPIDTGSLRQSPTSTMSSLSPALQLRKLEDLCQSLRSISSAADDEAIQQRLLQVRHTLDSLTNSIQESGSPSDVEAKGRAATLSTSENQVVCHKCGRFRGRRCEVKKHLKRHDRPYGCTHDDCHRTFGSKNDWKRHENSRHFQHRAWRCDEVLAGEQPCAKVYYRRESFRDHLTKEHKIHDAERLKFKCDKCHIGRNHQDRFWCGFCKQLIKLERRGLDAWTERFDHIDDHFMGRRGGPPQRIQDWVPANSDKPKGQLHPSRDFQELAREENSSVVETSSSASSVAAVHGSEYGGVPAGTLMMAETAPLASKRPAAGDLAGHYHKRPHRELHVTCCNCHWGPHSNQVHRACIQCGHHLCNDCSHELALSSG